MELKSQSIGNLKQSTFPLPVSPYFKVVFLFKTVNKLFILVYSDNRVT